jgi:serine/threonine protein kinase
VFSLNKIPRKRPTFNALLEHPWLSPLSPHRPDFSTIESENKQFLGEWVTETIATRNLKGDVEKAKPPLHTVNTEPPTADQSGDHTGDSTPGEISDAE